MFIPEADAWHRDHLLWSALDAGLGLGLLPASRVPEAPPVHVVAALLTRARGMQLHAAAALGARALGWPLPPEVDPAALARQALAHALVHQATRQRVTRAFSRAGVTHVFLKGALMDPLFFGGRGLRGSLDVDVLVSPAQWKPAQQALWAEGFSRELPVGHPVTARAGKELTFRSGDAVVDLHRGRMNSPPFVEDVDAVLARSTEYPVRGGVIPGASPEDLVVGLVGNLANDRFLPRIKLGLDAAVLLARGGVDVAVVAQRCGDAGCAGAGWVLGQLLRAHGMWAGPDLAAAPYGLLRPWLGLLGGVFGEVPHPTSHLAREVLEAWPWSGRWGYPPVALARWALLRTADHAWRLVSPR